MHLPGCAFDKVPFKGIVLQHNLYHLDLQAVPNWHYNKYVSNKPSYSKLVIGLAAL